MILEGTKGVPRIGGRKSQLLWWRVFLARSNPRVDRCLNPLPWDPLSRDPLSSPQSAWVAEDWDDAGWDDEDQDDSFQKKLQGELAAMDKK